MYWMYWMLCNLGEGSVLAHGLHVCVVLVEETFSMRDEGDLERPEGDGKGGGVGLLNLVFEPTILQRTFRII
jgi:hypothetical protein